MEIKEITPLSLWHCQLIYHNTFIDCKGSYAVPHKKLFIPHDCNDALDPQGLLFTNIDQLHIPDALDAHSMSNAPKYLIQKLELMDSANFRIYSFTTAMKDKHLMDNSLTSTEIFYTSIKIFLQAVNKQSVDILPEHYQCYLL